MIVVHKDLRVPMRDGIHLAADAYHAEGDMPRPALVALSPYGKELQALALTIPPQRRPSPLWDGCIEAGDIARVVKEGYVHVIGDVRGSGSSEGEHIGNYNAGGVPLGQDAYDFIEWVAAQPWCNGVVGMIGISYFGSMQIFAAAERPPHLKAIFVSGGILISMRQPITAVSCGSCRVRHERAVAATRVGPSHIVTNLACWRPTPKRKSSGARPGDSPTLTWRPGPTWCIC